MEAGRYAPTGGNLQNVRYLICDDESRLKKMAEMVVDYMRSAVAAGSVSYREERLKRAIQGWEEGHDTIMRNAPALILIHSNTQENPSLTNGIIAMSFIEVMAHAMGLGACYCGYFNNAVNNHPPLKTELGLPDEHSAAVTLLVGYPKIVYHRIPPRNEARFRYL
jgi:nitroreductase